MYILNTTTELLPDWKRGIFIKRISMKFKITCAVLAVTFFCSVQAGNWEIRGDIRAKKIGGDGWIIKKTENKAYLWDGSSWGNKFGTDQDNWKFKEVGNGWALGKAGRPGTAKANIIYQWDGSSWVKKTSADQSGWKFSKVGGDGWAIGQSRTLPFGFVSASNTETSQAENGKVYKWDGTKWEKRAGDGQEDWAFKEVGDGWALKDNNKIYKWDDSKWVVQGAWKFKSVDAGWVIAIGQKRKSSAEREGKVYYRESSGWIKRAGDDQSGWTFSAVGAGWAVGLGGKGINRAARDKVYQWIE